jgi:hypothetical protein
VPVSLKISFHFRSYVLSIRNFIPNSIPISFDRVVFIDAPVFKSFPAAYTLVRLGDPLLLTCHVDSNPPANILWTKNGAFVGGGSQYHVPDVHDDDYGVYACIATLGGQFTKIFSSTKVLPPGQSLMSIVDC